MNLLKQYILPIAIIIGLLVLDYRTRNRMFLLIFAVTSLVAVGRRHEQRHYLARTDFQLTLQKVES